MCRNFSATVGEKDLDALFVTVSADLVGNKLVLVMEVVVDDVIAGDALEVIVVLVVVELLMVVEAVGREVVWK